MTDTFQRVRKIITKELMIEFKEEDVLPNRSLEDIGGDSLDLIDLKLAIEEQFEIEIDGEEIDETTSFSDIVALIDSRLSAAA